MLASIDHLFQCEPPRSATAPRDSHVVIEPVSNLMSFRNPAMSDYSFISPTYNETAMTSGDLTALEIATYIVSALIGTAIVGVIVVLMLQ